ncbi:amidase [Candidatus Protochlamydia phocaeensis]|uniref:amidase n=1 Tax=Candidatus Protochlamydia phocaeensis TaxID=1414722 RepID=UPI000837D104|nr:amidase [Candidatus Protochlamydia phocaeensis]
MEKDIIFESAYAIRQHILKKELSPLEVARHFLAHIERTDRRFHFFLNITAENALKSAQLAEENLMKGHPLPLLGIPLAILDTLDMQGYPTTFGSLALKDRLALEDSFEIQVIKESGAIILGKINMSEFLFYPVPENLLKPRTLNPWDASLSAGNTAAAAAVASGCAPICIVGDIHASARVPSSFCGVFGLKSTRGKIPLIRKSLVPISEKNLYQKGPITRYVIDAALAMDGILNYSYGQHAMPPAKQNYIEAALNEEPLSYRLGWSPNLGFISVHPIVHQEMLKALKVMESLGHVVLPLDLEFDEGTLLHYQHILAADRLFPLLSLKRQHAHQPDHLCDYTQSWIHMGEQVTGMEYSLGLIHMEWIKSEIERLLEHLDFLVTPTVHTPPFPLSSAPKLPTNKQEIDPSLFYSAFTLPFNMSGHPAMNIPIGWTPEGHPIGMQVIGNYFSEDKMIQFAASLERVFRWPDKKPSNIH